MNQLATFTALSVGWDNGFCAVLPLLYMTQKTPKPYGLAGSGFYAVADRLIGCYVLP